MFLTVWFGNSLTLSVPSLASYPTLYPQPLRALPSESWEVATEAVRLFPIHPDSVEATEGWQKYGHPEMGGEEEGC